MVTITIVYDNVVGDPRLTNKWGFACLVETPDAARARGVLFDTGGDAPTLLANMAILGKDPTKVDAVVLSHRHGDHVGGLEGLLAKGAAPRVFMLASFPDSVRRAARTSAEVVDVTEPQTILPGIWTTGAVPGPIPEQALVVGTAEGYVLVSGCAHPGIEAMAAQALTVVDGPIILAVGGYHLGSTSSRAIERTVLKLQAMGVQAVAPTHCSGDAARSAFADAYGDRYYAAGAGATWAFLAP